MVLSMLKLGKSQPNGNESVTLRSHLKAVRTGSSLHTCKSFAAHTHGGMLWVRAAFLKHSYAYE